MDGIPDLDELVQSVRGRSRTDLDGVREAVAVADALGTVGDRLVTHFVQAARHGGCSWAQIGGQLGVSKQAAQQAFVPVGGQIRRRRFGRQSPEPAQPFERWTARARTALVLAEEDARSFGHTWLGTEHLLLGLGRCDGVAAEVLRRLGIATDDVRRHVEDIIGRGTGTGAGELSFTPRTKKVLDLAVREAAAMRCQYVGTEHVLLGLVREGEGVACQILVRLGCDLRSVRETVTSVVSRGGDRPAPGRRPTD